MTLPEVLPWLGGAVAVLTLAGGAWKAVSWHNGLVAKVDAAAAAAKASHELQAQQLDSIQSELKEHKDSCEKHFKTIYGELRDLSTRLARLEGKKS